MTAHSTQHTAHGIRIPKRLYEQVIAHCLSQHPKKEACGILAGPFFKQRVPIAQVYPMTNVENSPIGYAMDTKEQFAVEKQMRTRNQRMYGIYHSHTASEAYPSPVDVAWAIGPEISYVLVSLMRRETPVVRSFRIDDLRPPEKQIMEEPVILLDEE